MDFKVNKVESRHYYYPQEKLCHRYVSSPPRQRQITHSPQLRDRTGETYFEMYCFKSTFLKL